MKVSQHQRQVAWKLAQEIKWGQRAMYDDDRIKLAEIVIREFEHETQIQGYKADRREIVKRVKANQEVRNFQPIGFFGLEFILMIVVGWIISNILDYLWGELERYTLHEKGWPIDSD